MTKIITMTLTELIDFVGNGRNPKAVKQIQEAYAFAQTVHGDFQRASGEPFLEHDLAVAQIVAELALDPTLIVAAILHDSLQPHSSKTSEDIEAAFGTEVRELVVSVQNLHAYAEADSYRPQGVEGDRYSLEEVRKSVLTIIEGDIRVVLIRMAVCLHDLRRASHLDESIQKEIANEAMNIYAPLANRLGIWHLKWELEDLAFRYLEREQYKKIAKQLAERRVERAERVEQAVAILNRKIKEANICAEITGRPKHIYSIYKKMIRKRVGLDEIYDVQALRVIVEPSDPDAYEKKRTVEKEGEDRAACYLALAVVHGLWQPVQGEFDDYIAAPKPNGYKSLHTAVRNVDTGQTLEVQIRTRRMHEEAEKGVAAHWAYKEDDVRLTLGSQKQIQDLRELLANLRDPEQRADDFDIFETEIAAERIHVFTPTGDVRDLPIGSTPIDFAYQIHTEVGHRCRGARVNGKMVSLDRKLKSGDRVEILTSKRGGPSRDWMSSSLGYTGSARTRSKIRQWFRLQEREQNVVQGREAVTRELKRLGLLDTFSIQDIVEALNYGDEESFLAKVGFGDIQSSQISGAISLLKRDLAVDDDLRPLLDPPPKGKGFVVQGVTGLATRMAKCCSPIAPEPVVGYITRGQGVTIHRRDCHQLQLIDEKERLIDVGWGIETERYPIPVVVKAYRSPTLIDNIVMMFRGRQIEVPKTKSITSGTTMTVYLMVEVANLDELNWLLQKLENTQNVIEAYRERWQ